jgi:hypothetical protein
MDKVEVLILKPFRFKEVFYSSVGEKAMLPASVVPVLLAVGYVKVFKDNVQKEVDIKSKSKNKSKSKKKDK